MQSNDLRAKKAPKYRQIFEALRQAILSGEYEAGDRLPSESQLVQRFDTSRITVGRALRDLQQRGLVDRRAGSGTYVRARPPEGGLTFGLLIPDLGQTEIFEPICQGISSFPGADQHALLWGNASPSEDRKEEEAWQLCRRYVEREVDGVFFAAVESAPSKDETNRRILSALEQAGIPVVLLDRCVFPYPRRSGHDLVGVDNRRAGYLITEHLLNLGALNLDFLAYPDSATTVQARIAGYREALFTHGRTVDSSRVHSVDPTDGEAVARIVESSRLDGFVCGNDRTAGRLMHTLFGLGFRIPEDVRIVGIDDVRYATLLPVPLTTIRQPCREIGQAAMATMLERLARPQLPARDVLLDVTLVVRRSCGASPGRVGTGREAAS